MVQKLFDPDSDPDADNDGSMVGTLRIGIGMGVAIVFFRLFVVSYEWKIFIYSPDL